MTRAAAEWCLCVDWLKDMSWLAAKQATSIEIKLAKQRLTDWKREVKHQVHNATSKAHAWSKAGSQQELIIKAMELWGMLRGCKKISNDGKRFGNTPMVSSPSVIGPLTLATKSSLKYSRHRKSGLQPAPLAARLPQALTACGLVR